MAKEIVRAGRVLYGLNISLFSIIDDINLYGDIYPINKQALAALEAAKEDGRGPQVDELNKLLEKLAKEEAQRRLKGHLASLPAALHKHAGKNARILKVIYETANIRGPTEVKDFSFNEYVQMGRPRYLEAERQTTDTFRKIKKIPEKYKS